MPFHRFALYNTWIFIKEHIGYNRFSAATTLNNWQLVQLRQMCVQPTPLQQQFWMTRTSLFSAMCPTKLKQTCSSARRWTWQTPYASVQPIAFVGCTRKHDPQRPKRSIAITKCQTQKAPLESPVFITRWARTVLTAQLWLKNVGPHAFKIIAFPVQHKILNKDI